MARDHRHAVVALLPVQGDVLVAEPPEALERKLVVRTLGLLQTEDVGARRFDELRHKVDAQAHRVDVPGGDEKAHSFPSSWPDLFRPSTSYIRFSDTKTWMPGTSPG